VLALAKSDRRLEGMGTTLVAAMEVGNEILITSVGDSRAYLLEDDSFVPVTQDQSWVNEVGRVMGLDEGTLKTHPFRHVLTMAIGAGVKLIVNSYSCPWRVGSVLLLSSDGLHGVVARDQIEDILRDSESDLEEKCRRLIELARNAGAPDNVTAVLVRRVS
jgi:protein phosphatase